MQLYYKVLGKGSQKGGCSVAGRTPLLTEHVLMEFHCCGNADQVHSWPHTSLAWNQSAKTGTLPCWDTSKVNASLVLPTLNLSSAEVELLCCWSLTWNIGSASIYSPGHVESSKLHFTDSFMTMIVRVNTCWQGFPGGLVMRNSSANGSGFHPWVPSLSQGDLLEMEMATHVSILAWKIPWTEEPDGL